MPSIDDAIVLLNDAFSKDPNAIECLFSYYITCNSDLSDHPTITIRNNEWEDENEVGLLGILNGIFGTDKVRIGAILDDDNEHSRNCLVGFKKVNLH